MASGLMRLPPQLRVFTGQDSGEFVFELFIHSEEISDFPGSDPDVTGGHVRVGADVPEKLHHETLTETHDFGVRFALGIKVGPALASAHGQGGQGVLENLFESQKFQDAQVDRGVKSQAALIRADGAVHLNAKTTVDPDRALIVHPGHPEADHPFRLDQPFHYTGLTVFRIHVHNRLDRFGHFADSLVKFLFMGITVLDNLHDVYHLH